MTPMPEKRLHQRVAQRLTVHSAEGSHVALETINLSAGGLFCSSPAWVAPMTRLALALELPAPPGNGGSGAVVRGEAVVVRTEPSSPSATHTGGYRIALFFSRMDDDHRQALQTFLKSRTA
jgi:PilZ domain-containing protein